MGDLGLEELEIGDGVGEESGKRWIGMGRIKIVKGFGE